MFDPSTSIVKTIAETGLKMLLNTNFLREVIFVKVFENLEIELVEVVVA